MSNHKLKIFDASVLYLDFKQNYFGEVSHALVEANSSYYGYAYLQPHNDAYCDLISLYLINANLYHSNYDQLLNFAVYNYGPYQALKSAQQTFKTNPQFTANLTGVALNHYKKQTLNRLNVLLENRVSYRNFTDQIVMPPTDLANLLHYSFGTNRNQHRMVASAGGLYPIDLYLYINKVQGVPSGFYCYHPHQAFLEKIVPDYPIELKQLARMDNIHYHAASFFVFWVWNQNLSFYKYDLAALGFAYMEVGMIMQNLELVATNFGYGMCGLGGFNKNLITKALQIDHLLQVHLLHAAIVGPKP